MSTQEKIPVKAFFMLNLILASLFFAGGYALAYFTAPRTVIVERQPIVYNNTVIYNYTVPIENNGTVYVNQPLVINASYLRLEFVTRNVSYWIQPILLDGFWFNITLNLTAELYDIATNETYIGPVPALRVIVEYNVTHLYLAFADVPLLGTGSFSCAWSVYVWNGSRGWIYIDAADLVAVADSLVEFPCGNPVLVTWDANVYYAIIDSRYF